MSRLKVFVDGKEMPEAEAREFWKRFSAHMDAHKGDLAGFAEKEGFASVHPAMGSEGAELHASHDAAQKPYTTAPRTGSRSGSPGTQGSNGNGGKNH